MTFVKGMARPSSAGRRPGSKNKKTLLRAYEILAEKGLNPVERVLVCVELLEPIDQIPVWLKLLEYCEAKVKATDETPGTDDRSDQALLEQFEHVTDEAILQLIRDDEVV